MKSNVLNDDIIFPGGKRKAFTMSYDDGTIHDRRLVEIMNRYRVKGTFNLNSGLLGKTQILKKTESGMEFDASRMEASEITNLYQGHEIAGHGLFHSSPLGIGSSTLVYETIEDKRRLESLIGKPVRGYAYPFGDYNEAVYEVLRLSGYQYARTIKSSFGFGLPENFYAWHATCRHKDEAFFELLSEFAAEDPKKRKKLFYLWGHSYEFERDNNWNLIEETLGFISEKANDIWFATNIEICDYIKAFRQLEYSADGDMIFNPGRLSVMLERYNEIYTIEAGETIVF